MSDVRNPKAGESVLWSDGVQTAQITSTTGRRFTGGDRIPAFAGLARWNGGLYAENLEGMSIDRALEAAGLNFTVGFGTTTGTIDLGDNPIITPDGVIKIVQVEDTVRKSCIAIWPDGRGSVFGQIKSRYQPVQPREIGELGEGVVGLGHKLVAAGAYGAPLGSKMYLAFDVGSITIGGVDKHDMTLALLNSFDGHGGLHAMFAPLRLACTNQTEMTFGRLAQRHTIRHSGNVADKLKDLEQVIRASFTWTTRFQETAEKMLKVPMAGTELRQFAEVVLATPDRVKTEPGEKLWQARRDLFVEVAEHAEHNEFGRGTRFGVYNALASYLDHEQWADGVIRRQTARWERMLDGGVESTVKMHGAQLLMAGL